MEPIPDNDLMRRLCERDAAALEALYRRHGAGVFNFIRRSTSSREIAQELLQETFSRVWFSAHTFDPDRGSFRGWLYTVALNLARSEMSKAEYRWRRVPDGPGEHSRRSPEEIDEESPERVHAAGRAREAVSRALDALTAPHRDVLLLKNFQQLTFTEIAQATRTPESTVKARYLRAIAEMRRILSDEEAIHHVQELQA